MGATLADWQAAGHDAGSIIADPLLTGYGSGGIRLDPASPALALGFVPFDHSKAGVYGDPEWTALAAGWVYQPVSRPPAPRQ
jgi:hypothetical protein